MHLTIWEFVPLLAAPLIATGLVGILQRVFRIPGHDGHLTWVDIRQRWRWWATGILPVFLTPVVALLYLWPFAYLAWGIMVLADDPPSLQVAPPLFGSLGYLFVYGIYGVFMLIAAAIAVVVLIGVSWFVGRAVIWPELLQVHKERQDSDKAGDA